MPATKIVISSGNSQRAAVKKLLSTKITVFVSDNADVAVSGVNVTFQFGSVPQDAAGHNLRAAVNDNGASSVIVASDVNGFASAYVKLGDIEGTYTVQALAAGLTGSPLSFSLVAFPANSLLTLSEAKVYLSIPSGTTEKDEIIQILINGVSDSIEQKARQKFVLQEFEGLIYDGNGTDRLFTREFPLVRLLNNALSDVQWRSAPNQDWQNLETDLSFVLIQKMPSHIYLYRMTFHEGASNIKLNIVAGRDKIPGDIKLMAYELVAQAFKESYQGDGRLGRKSVAKSGGGTNSTDSYYDLYNERHKHVIARYNMGTP